MRRRSASVLAVVALLVTACSSGGPGALPPTQPAADSPSSTGAAPTAVPLPTTAVSSSAAPGDTSSIASTTVDSSTDVTTPAATSGTAAHGGAGGAVAVYTWWQSGSEKDGLDAMLRVFDDTLPRDSFVNLSTERSSANPKSSLMAHLSNGKPPDSFQWDAGQDLVDFITRDQVQPVDDVINDLGGPDLFPSALLQAMTVNGHRYAVPTAVDRTNVMWTNPKVLEHAGIDPAVVPPDIAAWITDLGTVRTSGIKTPLAIGGFWTQTQLLENVLLADLGAQRYTGLFNGSTAWGSDDVSAAIADYATLLTFANHAEVGDDWLPAIDAVADGTAAYSVMGDWALAEFDKKKKDAGPDYRYSPTPGTTGVFAFHADSYTLATGAPNPGGARDWLELVGSGAGLRAFTLAEGSIPARLDTDPVGYNSYQQTAIASWGTDTVVPSIAHGGAVSPDWRSDVYTAVMAFYDTRDQTALQDSLVRAARTYLR